MKLKIYLAGPIRGCNDDQVTLWRDAVKAKLRNFDFEDPVLWHKTVRVPTELIKLADCHIFLANMWKESIGTTVGIIRARQLGLPVVLMDLNRLNNPILQSIIAPEKPVHDLDQAVQRIKELAQDLIQPITIESADGKIAAFSPKRLARAINRAAAGAGVKDATVVEVIAALAIRSVLARGASAKGRALISPEIAEEVELQLDRLSDTATSPLPGALTPAVRRVHDEWKKRSEIGKARELLALADERVAEAERKATEWKEVVQALYDAQPPAQAGGLPLASFRSAKDVLAAISARWNGRLVIHPEAQRSAEDATRTVKAKDLDNLYLMLDDLGEYADARIRASIAGKSEPSPASFFARKRFAKGETHETKIRFRDADAYSFEGQALGALQHLKLTVANGQPLRIYFDRASEARLVVCEIGHRKTFGHNG